MRRGEEEARRTRRPGPGGMSGVLKK